VESLISIQRAYINTNHPNFLGAAAAMSSIMQNKQDEERKALMAEEKRKRDKRRQKELGAANGTANPDEEEHADSKQNLPIRSQSTKGSRSMSPHVGRNGEHGIAATLNGAHSNHAAFGGSNTARDSFLNYFFGKEGTHNTAMAPPSGMNSNRQAIHASEPSISQSIRRAEIRSSVMPTEDYTAPPEYGGDVSAFVSVNISSVNFFHVPFTYILSLFAAQ
jgi:dynamin 1-like protein